MTNEELKKYKRPLPMAFTMLPIDFIYEHIEDEDANGGAWCAFHQKPVRCDSRACEDILKKGGSNA